VEEPVCTVIWKKVTLFPGLAFLLRCKIPEFTFGERSTPFNQLRQEILTTRRILKIGRLPLRE
jgi:hypothetical protein